MSCFGCKPEIYKDGDEAKKKIQEEGQRLANESGEWYGVIIEEGAEKLVKADFTRVEHFVRFITPKL